MNGVIQTGLMAFPELANELADACPAIGLETLDFMKQCSSLDEAERQELGLKLAMFVMGVHAACFRLDIPLCDAISDMLTLPTDTINQRLKELDDAPVLQPTPANSTQTD